MKNENLRRALRAGVVLASWALMPSPAVAQCYLEAEYWTPQACTNGNETKYDLPPALGGAQNTDPEGVKAGCRQLCNSGGLLRYELHWYQTTSGGAVCQIYSGSNFLQDWSAVRDCAPLFMNAAEPSGKENGGSCPSCGNPVNPATGNKFQRELDYRGSGVLPLTFERSYNSFDGSNVGIGVGWQHTYSQRLELDHGIEPTYQSGSPDHSSPYPSAQAACEVGWLEVRGRRMGLAATTAVYEDKKCRLKEGTRILREISPHSTVYTPPSNPPLLGINARRADGKSLRFGTVAGGFAGDADTPARLQSGAGGVGYVLTNDDIVETYDAAGKLQTLKPRSGFQQTLAYDPQGRLSTVTDSFGRKLTFGYDALSRVQTVTDPDEQTYTYAYEGANLKSVTDPDGRSRVYHYTDARFPSALTGITDENGARYGTYTYDDMGRATITEHDGDADLNADRVVLTYNSDETTTAQDALGASRTYGFSTLFGIRKNTAITQPCLGCSSATATATTTYDANGYPDLKTDFRGVQTDYDYNSQGLEVQRIEAKGTAQQRTIKTQWHGSFRVPTQVEEWEGTQVLRRTTYSYDSATGDRLTETVFDVATNEVRTTTWTYKSFGRVETVNGPRTDVSDVTTYSYHSDCTTGGSCGQLWKITNALDQVTEITSYDAHGNPLTIVDPNGVTTTLTYDLRQRLKTRTVAGATTTFDYDGVGQLEKVTLPGGSFLSYTYDGAHRLTDIEDNAGNKIHYTLDAAGNRLSEEVFDPGAVLKRKQSQVFDTLGRLDKIRDAADKVTTDYGYDAQGNRTSQIDYRDIGIGHTTAYTPDALNRIKEVTDPLSGVTKYGYNALDQLTSVEDPKSLTTTYTINALGDVKSQTSPDTGTTQYPLHDAAGNRQRQVDARGVQVDYQYDALNRLTFVDYPGTAEDVTYSYDSANQPYGKGRLTGITDESGTTTLVYDARGNVTQESRVIGGTTYVTGFAYDLADRLTSITYPTGRTVTYTRNALGQVTKVETTVGSTTTTVADSVQYLPFGGIKSYTLGNGVAVTRAHDMDYRLEKLKDQGTATIRDVNLYYDLRGNVESLEDVLETGRSQTLDYDALSRLTFANGAYGDRGYGYDGVGNRLSEAVTPPGATDTYTYPTTSHRLQSQTSGASFTYDPAGNVTDNGSLSLTYNNAHRASAVGTVTNLYNASGQRVRKTVSGEQTIFHYDRAGQLIAETGSGGLLMQREYIWLEGLSLAVLAETHRPTILTDNTHASFSSTGTWSSSTATPGYEGSDYLSHAPAGTPAGTQVMDDLDSGTSKTGTWVALTGTPPGYQGIGYQRSSFSLSQNTFTWSLPLITPGDYRVYVRWVSDASYSTDARYTVTHANGSTTHSIDQTSGGGSWYLLGTYAFTSTAQIGLGDPAGGTLIADAVRVIPVTALADQASWAAPEAQSYEVYARWPAAAHHAKRAAYTITHGSGSAHVITDQSQSGGQWNLLGTYTFGSTTQGVSLRADPDATTVADAVRFVPTGASVTQQTTAYAHVDHLGTIQKMTDVSQQIVWQASYEPFGKATITREPYYENPLRFPGQYFDAETGLHQNWHRDYDPSTGRYMQSDPIGLRGGLNTYGYVGANPVRYFDPTGLERWDFDGPGDTSACAYYDQKAQENPKCGYYKEAAKICRGQNNSVNRLTSLAIGTAYATGSSNDSQSVILTNIRNKLTQRDAAARAGGTDDCGCTLGDDIDSYHNDVFREVGLSPIFYGGNLAPQNSGLNPVPYDPREADPLDDFYNYLKSPGAP